MLSKTIPTSARILCTLMLGAATLAPAVQTQSISDESFEQFQQGRLDSVSLSADGFLRPSHERVPVGDTRMELVWDVLGEADGSVLAATGHRGTLVRIGEDGTTRSLATVEEPQLTALARWNDSVLVAAAPGARIYRLGADDALTTFTRLDADFVWKMVSAGERVFALTGPDGRLFELSDAPGRPNARLVHEFPSANLLDLWIDREGVMGVPGAFYIGGQDPGWLYRFDPADDSVEVILNAEAEEVRAIVPVEQGVALALNTMRSPNQQALALTLNMAGAGAQPNGNGGPAPPQANQELNEVLANAQGSNYGPPRSMVVVLDPQGFVHEWWTSSEPPIHGLAATPDGGLLVATGSQGRVFEVSEPHQFSLVADSREQFIMRLRPEPGGYLLGMAGNGVVERMLTAPPSEAVFESRPIDARSHANWGAFYVRGRDLDGRVRVAFRIGNDGDPDSEYWGEWTEPRRVAGNEPVDAPAGPSRFLQYRLTLESDSGMTPAVDTAEIFLRGLNAPPRLGAITIQEAPQPGRPNQANGGQAGPQPRPPQARGSNGSGNGEGEASGREARSNSMLLNVNWEAMDPNDDTLTYEIHYKAEDEDAWKLIDDALPMPQMALNISGVADGRYRFKVVARDDASNPPGEGLNAERISDQFTIDNSPPQFDSLSARVSGRRATIEAHVSDGFSVISQVQVDLNNGDTYPLAPADGIMDETAERFEWRTDELEPGEYVATLAATDRFGNTQVRKVIFSID